MKKTTLSIITASLLLSPAFAEEVLEEIIVTSTTKLAQKIKNSTSNVTVITAEDIKERGYQSVTEAISHATGISISNNGGLGSVSSIFIRGMKTEKILVLLDGITLNNPSSTDGQAFFEHISLDNIERIEIIKGGVSSTWGSDASAGVINIITKEPKDGIAGNMAITYGSHSTKKLSGSISIKEDVFSAIINLSKLKTEGYSTKLPIDGEADGYENTSANIKLSYNINEQNKISINYNNVDANTEYDGSFSALGAEDPVANIDMKQKDMSMRYEFNNDKLYSRLQYNHSTVDRLDTSDSAWGDALISYNSTIKEFSWISKYSYAENSNIFLGLEKKSTEGIYQFNDFPATSNKFEDKAVFVGLQHTFNHVSGSRTLVETSLRKDFFDAFDNEVSYKAGIKHFFKDIDGLSVGMNHYKSVDAPNSYQMANALFGTTLKPDTTKGYDITLAYKDISLTYFSNTIHDKISYDMTNWGYKNNTGLEKIKGIEVSAKHSFNSVVLSANYTHLFKYEDENGNILQKRAKDVLNVNLDYYVTDNTHIGLEAQHIGKRIETEQLTGNDINTGNYTIFNVNFGTQITEDLNLKINAKNIFDKEYETTLGYSTEGRSIYATIEYKF